MVAVLMVAVLMVAVLIFRFFQSNDLHNITSKRVQFC